VNTQASQKSGLQNLYAPNSICFGCGPANPKGLRIQSFVSEDSSAKPGELWMEFLPEPHHEAFPGMVNGGIIGSLLDCHSNWAAAIALMKQSGGDAPACTVTADFHVKLRAPTPSTQKIRVRAWPADLRADRAKIEAELYTVPAEGEPRLTATCTGTFVSVKPGHPAYHRWG
jgi:acyl-coenzyme A thioesterase PaaI-like protein